MKIDHKVQFFPGNGKPIVVKKIDRNKPCECGSGKKAKYCCGTDSKLYRTE